MVASTGVGAMTLKGFEPTTIPLVKETLYPLSYRENPQSNLRVFALGNRMAAAALVYLKRPPITLNRGRDFANNSPMVKHRRQQYLSVMPDN